MRSAQGKDGAHAVVKRITGQLAELAERAVNDAERLRSNARRALRRAQAEAEAEEALAAAGGRDAAAGRRRGRLRRAVNDLTALLDATRQVAAQTRQRLAGSTPSGGPDGSACTNAMPDRSPRDGSARRWSSATRRRSWTTRDGVVLDHNLEQGIPPDAPQLAPAVERVKRRTGRTPKTVTADRGYGENSVEDDLREAGVRHVVIPREGKPGKARQAEERRPAFRKTITWRTGSEGRISSLKRGYGWDRTRLDGTEGARIWTGQAVLAHNLVKIGTLAG